MIRVNVLAEGQTEMNFVKKVLNNFFAGRLFLNSRCVLTSRDNRRNYEFRGGMTTYRRAKNDIICWLKSDSDAYVTTMFDFFQIPKDFPDYTKAMGESNHAAGAAILEKGMRNDIQENLPSSLRNRFIPYIQLHEVEALLYTDLNVIKKDYLDAKDVAAIDRLISETKDIPPEEINHGEETAPSKRLMNAINYRKGNIPVAWLESITIPRVRDCCPHFSGWIDKLSNLTEIE